MDEGVVYVLGIVVTFFVFRWILNGPASSTSAASTESLEQKIERLGEIFPSTSPALFREVLASNGGSLSDAIEFLMSQTQALSASQSSLSSVGGGQVEELLTLRAVHRFEAAELIANEPPASLKTETVVLDASVDPNRWTKDPEIRKKILQFKKQQMLEKARDRFKSDCK